MIARTFMRLTSGAHSIGATLFAFAAALTTIVVLLAAGGISGGLTRLSAVQRLEATSAISDRLLQASDALAFERDLTLAALNETDPRERADLTKTLAQARGRAADASMRALAGVRRDPTLFPWIERLSTRVQAISRLRAEADETLSSGEMERAGLVDDWIGAVTGSIEETDALWLVLVSPYSGVDATVTQRLRYMRALSTVSDYSGRERSLVTQMLSGRDHISPYELAQMNHARGVLDVSWRAARDLAIQGNFYEEIAGNFLDAKSQYDTLHGMLLETFYAPNARGGALPLSPSIWLALSEQYGESLDQLRSASRAALGRQLQHMQDQAFSAVLGQSGVLAAALTLCALCSLAISRVVVQPVNAIVGSLVAASRGERVDFTKHQRGRRDEIGQLIEVLHAFEMQVDLVRKTAIALDQSEQRLRAIRDNAVDSLITIDDKGDIEAFNPASERFFDMSAAEAIGKHISTVLPALFRGEGDIADAPASSTAPNRSLAGASSIETIGLRKDGFAFPIELTLSEINLPGASLLSAIIRDIGPRKTAEAALAAHTQALERSNKELDDFAYIASHDLKEPLRGLHNHARFLLEDNEGKLDDDSVRRLNRLVALSQRMERLVNDLLYFSRLGRQELAVRAIDLTGVISDIEGTLDHFLEEHGARIVVQEPLPTIVCDAPRVSELFRNLITNAVKYNDKSDKVVEVGALASKRAPHGALLGPVFFVRDNGAGIPAEFHHEVFRIFKRLNNHGVEAEGTGVGLTFVKKIVERHGGEIWIESTPGEGATFLFTLEPSHADRAPIAA